MNIYQMSEDDSDVEERVEWIYTYADMVTLLLCFFVLLFATSSPEQGKLQALSDAFNRIPWVGSPFTKEGSNSILDMNTLASQIIKKQIATREKIISSDWNGLKITFSDAVLFEKGSATPKKESYAALENLAVVLHTLPNTITIAGHTDDTPIKTKQFSSNWALSSARAVSVAEILVQYGIKPERIKIVAYGATQPKVANVAEENREINRRIDILVER